MPPPQRHRRYYESTTTDLGHLGPSIFARVTAIATPTAPMASFASHNRPHWRCIRRTKPHVRRVRTPRYRSTAVAWRGGWVCLAARITASQSRKMPTAVAPASCSPQGRSGTPPGHAHKSYSTHWSRASPTVCASGTLSDIVRNATSSTGAVRRYPNRVMTAELLWRRPSIKAAPSSMRRTVLQSRLSTTNGVFGARSAARAASGARGPNAKRSSRMRRRSSTRQATIPATSTLLSTTKAASGPCPSRRRSHPRFRRHLRHLRHHLRRLRHHLRRSTLSPRRLSHPRRRPTRRPCRHAPQPRPP